ncbi:MAG TPA: chemotaxis protein CheA [Spirochaetota bacterium]|nr:chemotaxis protein CheA [Spirochaetota bacterium]
MSESGLVDIFLNECSEILTNLESDLVTLEERSDDEEIINRIFRYFHTLKGSSGIAGYTVIYEFTHDLETLFDKVRSGELEINKEITDLLLDSLDYIKMELFTQSESDDLEGTRGKITSKIKKYLGSEPGIKEAQGSDFLNSVGAFKSVGKGERYYSIKALFREDIFNNGIDPLMIIEDLSSLGEIVSISVDVTKIPDFDRLDPEKCFLSWSILLRTEQDESKIRDVFLFVYDDNDIDIENVTEKYLHADDSQYVSEKKLGEILLEKGILTENQLEELVELQKEKKFRLGDIVVEKGLASQKQIDEALFEQEKIKKKIEINTVRVDSSKLDNLMNLLGEIVIGQAALHRIADELDEERSFRLKNSLYSLDRITREFQEQIMSIRMVPIGPTFEQFRRFVRDVSQSMGKEIKLRIEGGETELDKTVIEKIGDPLKHMIRNAIDHGIETSDERKRRGKPSHWIITLKAYHQEGNVYIDIIDDGRGLDVEKIKKKAIDLGLISSDEEVSKERIVSFIFHPGFSTAEKATELSGRGVGMDVVKTNIEQLRGSVDIKTKEGEGTLIRIKLPLTLAIIEGMLVRVGTSILIIPLLSVIETIQIKKEDYKTVEGKGEVILVRGEYISLIRLYELFGINSNNVNPWDGLIVIVESDGEKLGIMIDDLLGQQQIVIKSLDHYISESRAISGATILGDGRVALILDIHGMIEEIKGN